MGKYRSIGSPKQENSFFKDTIPIIRDDREKLVCLGQKGDSQLTGTSIAAKALLEELREKLTGE